LVDCWWRLHSIHCAGPIQMAANNSDSIQEELGEGGVGVKHEAEEEAEGAPSSAAQATATTMLPRSSSRPQLDLSGAAIHGTLEDRNPTILLPNQSDDISHLALDIGGSLIKLVYFSRHAELSTEDKRKISTKRRLAMFNGGRRSYPILGGRLHFVKFETGKLNECLDFISSKQLLRGGMQTMLWIVNNLNLVSSSVFYDPSVDSVHL